MDEDCDDIRLEGEGMILGSSAAVILFVLSLSVLLPYIEHIQNCTDTVRWISREQVQQYGTAGCNFGQTLHVRTLPQSVQVHCVCRLTPW